jgi:hypothetical protein
MATVNKNFRIKHGLVVEGSTATVNGQNILTEIGSDQYILDLVGGENLIDSVASGLSVDANNQLSIDRTVVDGWYDSNGAAAAALSDAQDYADTAEADAVTAANSYTDGRETAITTAYEAYADQAEVDAKAYTDTRETAITTAYEAYADQAEVDAKAYTDTRETAITTAYQGYADTAEQDAKDYADDLINDASNISTKVWSAYKSETEIGIAQSEANSYTDTRETAITTAYEAYADQAEVDAKAYTDTEIAALVDSAPALLDTLNELAAAIGDNPNYATDLATSVGTKVSKAGDTMTGLLVLSADPSANLGAATKQYVDQAEADAVTAANSYTDGRETAITTAYEAYADQAEVDAKAYTDTRETAITTAYEAYADQAETDAITSAQGSLDDVLDGTTSFSEVNVSNLTSQRAVQGVVATAQAGSSMMSWSKASYPTAKAWVKFATATHSQISEVLLTTDSSNNISITEFGMVGTNGSLGSVGASYLNGNIAIEVDTVHAATTVTVVATLIK